MNANRLGIILNVLIGGIARFRTFRTRVTNDSVEYALDAIKVTLRAPKSSLNTVTEWRQQQPRASKVRILCENNKQQSVHHTTETESDVPLQTRQSQRALPEEARVDKW
jgi:hypothetical protein